MVDMGLYYRTSRVYGRESRPRFIPTCACCAFIGNEGLRVYLWKKMKDEAQNYESQGVNQAQM